MLPLFSGCSAPLIPNPTSDFEYQVNDDNTGIIINKYIGTRQDVVIPSEIDGLPVIFIRGVPIDTYTTDGAFRESNITSVVIPSTVKLIAYGTFANCKELTTVRFLKNSALQYIVSYAFWGCEKLEKIDLSDTKLKHIGHSAFKGCTALKEIKLPDSVEIIDAYAFTNCSSLWEIDLPLNLTEIGEMAFENCTSLHRVVIPPNLNILFFSRPAFYNVSPSIVFEFEEGWERIDGYAMIICNTDVRVIVPKSVKRFSSSAFFVSFPGKFEFVFCGDAPEIIEDWLRDPTIYYDPSTSGWDTFEGKDKFEMIPHIEK